MLRQPNYFFPLEKKASLQTQDFSAKDPTQPASNPTPFDIPKTRPILLWLTWTQVVDGSWLQMFMSALFFPTGAHPYGPILQQHQLPFVRFTQASHPEAKQPQRPGNQFVPAQQKAT